MNQPDGREDEEDKETEEKLKKEIYNSNNQISMEDATFENINSNITFNISKILMESENDISLINSYDNEKLKGEFYKYFDNFEYVLYNKSENEN